MRAFLNNHSGFQKTSQFYLQNLKTVLETEYLGNRNCYHKKLSSVPREGDRDYFVAPI